MDPEFAKELRKELPCTRKGKIPRKRKFQQETPTNVSSATLAENSNAKSIWNDNFPFGDVIDKNFITEKDRKEFEKWGFEKYFHVLKAGHIQLVSIGRCMEQKVNDLEKKNKCYIEQVTDLENKLSESEKNVGKLKKDLEELSLEKSRVMAREEELMEENSKIKIKLQIKERMIGELEANVEELKGEIPLHEKAGFDKAVKQVLGSVSKLKP